MLSLKYPLNTSNWEKNDNIPVQQVPSAEGIRLPEHSVQTVTPPCTSQSSQLAITSTQSAIAAFSIYLNQVENNSLFLYFI